MNRTLKISLIVVGVLLFTLIVTPFLLKGKIKGIIEEQANQSINAKMAFSDLSLSLLSDFPNLNVTLDGLSITGKQKFEGDTLVYLESLSLSVDVMSAFGDKGIEIRKIKMVKPYLQAKVLADSSANWDIAIADTTAQTTPETTESAPMKIFLRSFIIEEGHIKYSDETMAFASDIKGVNLDMKGDMTATNTDLDIDLTSTSVDVIFDKIRYLKNASCNFQGVVGADLDKFIFTFKENQMKVNGLEMAFDGMFSMPEEGYGMDLKFSTTKSDFKTLLALVPLEFMKDVEGLKADGQFTIEGFAKGTYIDTDKLPAFDLKIVAQNGRIQYPSLPKSIDNINLNFEVSNPGGLMDNTIADLSKFHFELSGNPFDLSFYVKTPISNADFKATAKGIINLTSLKEAVPLDSMEISGLVTADISIKGQYASIEKELYEEIEAKGDLKLSNFVYKSSDLKQPVLINNANMVVTPKQLNLLAFDMKIGDSDMKLQGSVENYIAYALKDQTLKGVLNHQSSYLDINQLMGLTGDEAAPADTTPAAPGEGVEIPKNIDFTLNSSIAKMKYDNMNMTNAQGAIILRDGKMLLNGLRMNMLKGEMVMNGVFDTQTPKRPTCDFKIQVNNFDIHEAANTFAMIDSLLPIAKKSEGAISMALNYVGALDADLMPVLNSVNGSGTLKSSSLKISGSKVQEGLVSLLKDEKYKTLSTSALNVDFEIKDGNINVKPFTTAMAGKNFKIAGSQNLDKTTDFNIKTTVTQKEITSAGNSLGLNLKSSDPNKQYPVTITMKGKVDDPKFAIDMGEATSQLEDEVKEEVKKEAVKVVEKEADKIINDAVKDPETKKQVDDVKKKIKGLF